MQLAGQLGARIKAGDITAALPTLTQLAEETGLALNTVRCAIKMLEDEGLICTVPGRGMFVKPRGT